MGKNHASQYANFGSLQTDMFELFSSQVENKKLIEELMGKYVDKEGNALPLKRERKESKHVTDWRNLV